MKDFGIINISKNKNLDLCPENEQEIWIWKRNFSVHKKEDFIQKYLM